MNQIYLQNKNSQLKFTKKIKISNLVSGIIQQVIIILELEYLENTHSLNQR